MNNERNSLFLNSYLVLAGSIDHYRLKIWIRVDK